MLILDPDNCPSFSLWPIRSGVGEWKAGFASFFFFFLFYTEHLIAMIYHFGFRDLIYLPLNISVLERSRINVRSDQTLFVCLFMTPVPTGNHITNVLDSISLKLLSEC